MHRYPRTNGKAIVLLSLLVVTILAIGLAADLVSILA